VAGAARYRAAVRGVAALLVNPTAGRGRAARLVDPVRSALRRAGLDVLTLAGRSAAESVALTRAAVADGVAAVVAVGGDGLVHCAAQAVAGTGTALAVIPAGTGNDFAEVLDLPRSPAAAAAAIAAGRCRTLDLGLAVGDHATPTADLGPTGKRWWAGVLGAGFDSAVNERANRMRWPSGPRRYDLAIFAELYRLRPRPATLVLDGTRLDTEITLVAVGNGPQYGGGFRICPDARMDDALLDLCVVGPISRRELVRLKPRTRLGRHVDHPAVHMLRAREVRLESPGVVAYADGERVAPLPLTIRCIPAALRVIVP
jgi:diacylglycerol kinase (ATP)